MWPFEYITTIKKSKINEYPRQNYKKIICSRKHCNDECIINMNYRYWIKFLIKNKIDYEEFYRNIHRLDMSVRYDVYSHVLKIVDDEKGIEFEPCLENENTARIQINEDCKLIRKIFEKCKKTNCDEFERIFNLYKTITNDYIEERTLKYQNNLLEVIYKLNGLANSTEQGVYKILKVLIEKHGLLLCVENELEVTGDKCFDKEYENSRSNIEDIKNKSLDENTKNNITEIEYIDKNEKNITTSSMNNQVEITKQATTSSMSNQVEITKQATTSSMNNQVEITKQATTSSINDQVEITKQATTSSINDQVEITKQATTSSINNQVEITKQTIYEVFKKIIFSKNDTFMRMTDMVLSLGCTYSELIKRAAEISLYNKVELILTVLNAKGNYEYYLPLMNKKNYYKKMPKRKEANYFDFLVIQNETIKAQENIKNELLAEIKELKLKLDNQKNTENDKISR